MTAVERLAAEQQAAFTAGYVTDLEPIDLIPPCLPTYAERPYTLLDRPKEPRP